MRRLLLISYFFPPLGGIGVQRPLRFARYLPQHGWDVTVLTPARPTYPIRDETILRDDEPFSIVRTSILDLPERPYRLRQALAERLAPDARAGWIPFAAGAAKRLAANADAILSTSPPMSAHYIAKAAARSTSTPWVADFRDPYADNPYEPRSASVDYRGRQADVLSSADAITTAWPAMAETFRSLTTTPIHVLMNGYDPRDFEGPSATPDDGKIRLVHVGALYGMRSPAMLVKALAQAAADTPEVREQLRLRLVGRVDEAFLGELRALGPMVEMTDFVPRQRALEEQAAADVLLLLFAGDSEAAQFVPGKLLEYWASGKHVLAAVGPSTTRDLLEAAGGSTVVNPDDVAGMADVLRKLARGERELSSPDPAVVQRYSAPVLAAELAAILDETVGSSKKGSARD